MNKLNILLLGDSFAADWSVKYNQYMGWPSLLAEHHNVTNLAQAGVSEYKIYKQVMSANLDNYDIVIVAHTSPYRVPTRRHPVHYKDNLHKHSDLLYSDISYHYRRLRHFFNYSVRAAYNFILYHYDEEYFITTYQLYREKINQLLANKKVIVISTLDAANDHATEKNILNFCELLSTEPGLINHYSESGNKIIFEQLTQEIKRMTNEH
jgi:hypothetical protein